MGIMRYPNGKVFSTQSKKAPASPNLKKKVPKTTLKKPTEFGKRGMRFEEAINQSNDFYLARKLAVVYKKPTPIQIVKVDYPKRSAAMIKEAYFRQASTTDYNGVYQGYYLDFEAKETKNKTSFPLSNFHQHQLDHMEACLMQDGICFVLLWFSSLHRCFYLSAEKLLVHWKQQDDPHGKKSISLTEIEAQGIEIIPKLAPQIPYLEAVQTFISMLKENNKNGKS
jgi:recombination protein U